MKMISKEQKTQALVGIVLMVALVLLVVNVVRSSNNPESSGYKAPPTKAQVQAMITSTENDGSLSPMAKKMTLGSLERLKSNVPN